MMSLWDALRMNMMISYQELVRTFPKHRITKVNNETVSYFCEGYKILFSTMVPYMNAMVELAKNRVPLYHIMDVAKQMENN